MSDAVTQSVELRPMTEQDLDLWETALGSPDGTGAFQWFGFTSIHEVRRRHAADGLVTPEAGMLAVRHDGETVGRVEWWPWAWGKPATSACWTIAIGLFDGSRGRGIGTAAHVALVAYLFDHTRAERVQAFTDASNVAERRALERSGFELEGVLRRAQWRQGAWHDQALYSMLRPTPDA